MRGHLKDDLLLDALQGAVSEDARRHLEACAGCAARLEEARGGWALAREAAVPEPSPLYWESFRQQIDRRIRHEASPRRRVTLLWPALVATAVGAVVAVTFINPAAPSRPRNEPPARMVPAWSAPADLPGLDSPVTPDETMLAADCEDLAECLAGLSDEETLALAEILQADLGSSP